MPPGRCSLQPTTRRKPARNLGENNGTKGQNALSSDLDPEDFAQSIEVQVQSTCQQLLDGLHALGMPVVDGLNTLSERTSFNVLFLAGSHFWHVWSSNLWMPKNCQVTFICHFHRGTCFPRAVPVLSLPSCVATSAMPLAQHVLLPGHSEMSNLSSWLTFWRILHADFD